MYYLKIFKLKPPSYRCVCYYLQLLVSIFFFYYFYQESNRFYCFLTGRKGLIYLTEDVFKLVFISHRETTEIEWGKYLFQMMAIIQEKIIFKLNQHFIQSTTTFAQKSLMKYTENLFELCSPSFKQGSNGWYGYIEPVLRLFIQPTEMSYCFLDSNRLFNSFLSMEMEKYILQLKINLISMSSTGLISITMSYRACVHLWVEYSPKTPISLEMLPDSSSTKTSIVLKPKHKTKKEK